MFATEQELGRLTVPWHYVCGPSGRLVFPASRGGETQHPVWKAWKSALEKGSTRDEIQMVQRSRHKSTWMRAFLREMFSMPRRHIVVFLIATLVFMILEVEFTAGWHLIHILEVLGVMGFLYLLWVAWHLPPDSFES